MPPVRQELQASAGIQGLEVVDPAEEGFAERAARIFWRDGFVAVKDVLTKEQVETMRAGCDKVIRKMMAADPDRSGNRGSHRSGNFYCSSSCLTAATNHELAVVATRVRAFWCRSYSFGSAPGHFGCQDECECLPNLFTPQNLLDPHTSRSSAHPPPHLLMQHTHWHFGCRRQGP